MHGVCLHARFDGSSRHPREGGDLHALALTDPRLRGDDECLYWDEGSAAPPSPNLNPNLLQPRLRPAAVLNRNDTRRFSTWGARVRRGATLGGQSSELDWIKTGTLHGGPGPA